jgi:heme exporter protein D
MSWGSLDNFLAMGGYGLYVWGSYAVTLALMIAEIALLARRRRSLLASKRPRGMRSAEAG